MSAVHPEERWQDKVWGSSRAVWGSFPGVEMYECSTERGMCSLHYHPTLFNQFLVLEGCIDVEYLTDEDQPCCARLEVGDCLIIKPKVVHRFLVVEPGSMIELYWNQEGTAVNPAEDIVRLHPGSDRCDV